MFFHLYVLTDRLAKRGLAYEPIRLAELQRLIRSDQYSTFSSCPEEVSTQSELRESFGERLLD
ncbi:MAG: hypothetical protein ACTHK2_09150 [Dokdonella sp.]|uniref:hypothetical protein n=1 Tax=Dokdonella sp. TaxID=2291710 RepID=UPI003F8077D1